MRLQHKFQAIKLSLQQVEIWTWAVIYDNTEEDRIHQLDRADQVTILPLRTGHCQLLSHHQRPKISHSDECPCGTGSHTSNHILQSCPTFNVLRCQTWPSPEDAHRKSGHTVAHCGLCPTHWTENLAWLGMQKKMKLQQQTHKKMFPFDFLFSLFYQMWQQYDLVQHTCAKE